MTKSSQTIILGVDGGSSKTAFLLCNGSGRILARHRGPGANIEPPYTENSIGILTKEIHSTCDLAGIKIIDIDYFGLCLCGLDFQWEQEPQMKALSTSAGFDPTRANLVNDGLGALWGASPASSLVMLQYGSGYCCGWRKGFGSERKFDRSDMLRLFDIRTELITLLARILDGFYEESPLLDSALEYLELSRDNLAEAFLRSGIPHYKVETTPPIIFEAWEKGDPNAKRLVNHAMDDFLLVIKTMIGKIDDPTCTISLGGGVINQAPQKFWDEFEKRTQESFPRSVLSRPELPPEYGAAVMAAYHLGIDPVTFFRALRENFQI